MPESPIPSNAQELLTFRRDFSELNIRLAVLEETVRWIKENMQKQDSMGRQVFLIALASLPGLLAFAALGFLYVNGALTP